jgi:hypothetical protein
MKNLNRILSVLIIWGVGLVISANAQITSISQIKDVKSTDQHYQALQSLIERYDVFEAYPDGTFRANQPLTRKQFVILLDSGLDRLMEMANEEDQEILASQLFRPYSFNNSHISAVSQIKDLRPSDDYYAKLESLVERYGIDIIDADKNFRPEKSVTEKEFYTWIGKIFGGAAEGTPSATRMVSRSEWVMVMNSAFDAVSERIADKATKSKPKPKETVSSNNTSKSTPPVSNTATSTVIRKSKLQLINELPSIGKAKIVDKGAFYLPDNTCANLASAELELKAALKGGGIWDNYKVAKGDSGDIVYETNNTCSNGKIIILRVGTALVTIGEKGIKRLK